MAGRACHVVGSATQVGLTQALGRQGQIMGKLIIAIGVVILCSGLFDFPPILDFLPLSLVFPSSDPHSYYRAVPGSQAPVLASILLVVLGSLLCWAGLTLHRRSGRA